MRKYIIGFAVGASLMFAVQAGAATLLGSTIDAVIQVEVDGENLGQAPVIDGVSYLPVRKFGDKAGYNVGFGEGKATLTSNDAEVIDTIPTETGDQVVTETKTHNYTLKNIDKVISDYESMMRPVKLMLKASESLGDGPEEISRQRAYLNKMEEELARLKVIKAELEAQQ